MSVFATLKRGLVGSHLLCLVTGLAALAQAPVPAPRRELDRFLWPRAEMHLTDANDRDLRPEAFRDKVVAVGFFDSGCSAPCALRVLDLAKVAAALPAAARPHIALVVLTGDPAHDTPQELTRFAKGMGLTGEAVTLLRGDEAGLSSLYQSIGWRHGASVPDDVPPSIFVFDRLGQSAMRYDASPLDRGRLTRDLAALVSFSNGVGRPPTPAPTVP